MPAFLVLGAWFLVLGPSLVLGPTLAQQPAPAVSAEVTFRDIAAAAGVGVTHVNGASPDKYFAEIMGSGGLFFDFDDDGWIDIFLVDGGSVADPKVAATARHRLFRNRRNQTLLTSPTIAASQQQASVDSSTTLAVDRAEWVEGLSQLTAAIAGTYGDEGVRIVAALDKMASGLGKWDRAIQAFETRLASELPAASPQLAVQLRTTLARTYLERSRLGDALRELDAAIALEPGRADLHVLRGFVLDAFGRSADADRAFRAGWALDASDPIKAYYAVRRNATVDDTSAGGARDALAAAYRSLSREESPAKAAPFIAIGVLPDLAGGEPVLPPAAYAQGFARIARGEYAEAIAEFRKAAATDPLLTDLAARSTVMTQAVAALRQGRLEQARSLLEGADALRDSSEAHRVLGLIHWANAQDDKSIVELESAIRRNPRDAVRPPVR